MDRQTLEKLYNQYATEVYLYAFSLCKSHHDAQELVSDTFFKALLSTYKINSNFKYWLLRVCKNSWLDGLKKRKYLSDQSIEEIKVVSNIDATISLISDEERRILYEAIQNMPRSYNEIITLYYYCDMTLIEISEIMNISNGASRMLISRARKYLKEQLNKEDFI